MALKENVTNYLGFNLRQVFMNLSKKEFSDIYEIRLRTNKPLIVIRKGEEKFITKDGKYTLRKNKAFIVESYDIQNTLEIMSKYSMYALEDELREGYITLRGGHRVGVVGTVIKGKDSIKSIRYIGSINFRIAHQILGAADGLIQYIYDGQDIYNTLIVSPPGFGKTTMLRDLVRQLSDGTNLQEGLSIGVVDERSEIGGCYKAVPQNDIGIRTDILDGCGKPEGMSMLIRSMSPKVIAVDEIGTEGDLLAIEEAIYSGVSMICTVHGENLDDIMEKSILNEMVKKEIFQRIVFISQRKGPGTIESIIDGSTLEDCRIRRII